MTVNVHSRSSVSNMYWNLGLMCIHGSMAANKCVEILTECLNQQGILLEIDIVAFITDGCNVMVKVGKDINAEHQLCFAHGIHLAICDVLYSRRHAQSKETEIMTLSDEDDDGALEDLDSGFTLVSESEKMSVFSDENISELIKRVRKLVISFKRSPTKNDVLQTYVKS